MMLKTLVVIALVALLLVAHSSAAMSALDAFKEARKFHKARGDANFVDNYNPTFSNRPLHPGITGGVFGHNMPPMYAENERMPHLPGGDFGY
jgi:hypothetical protein